MTDESNKHSRAENKTKKTNILDEISNYDALAIIKILARNDESIAKKLEQTAIKYLSRADIKDIASQVYSELDALEIEDVWDRSGSTREGYVDPI